MTGMLFKCRSPETSCGRYYRGPADSFCCPRCWSDLVPHGWQRPPKREAEKVDSRRFNEPEQRQRRRPQKWRALPEPVLRALESDVDPHARFLCNIHIEQLPKTQAAMSAAFAGPPQPKSIVYQGDFVGLYTLTKSRSAHGNEFRGR